MLEDTEVDVLKFRIQALSFYDKGMVLGETRMQGAAG